VPATLNVRPASAVQRPVLPAISIRPVPRLEPPTDDDLGASDPQAPTLPLDFGPPAIGVPRAGTIPSTIADAGGPDGATVPVTSGRPSVAPLIARRFVSTCLEVVGGYRPATHLRPLCAPDQFERIVRLLTGRRMTAAPVRSLGVAKTPRTPVAGRAHTGAPPRHGRAEHTSPGDRIGVRKIQVCEPLEGVAEVAVVLTRQERVWAMALRLEERKGRWICTALDVL
jgi:Family of unknown function (DUF6459)